MRVEKKIFFGRSKEYGFIWCCLAGKNTQRFDLRVLLVGQSSADWQKIEVGLKGWDLTDFKVDEAIWSHFWNLRVHLLNFFLLQIFDCRIGFWCIELWIKVTYSLNLEGAIWNPFYNNTNYFRYNLNSLTSRTYITKQF